MKTIAAMWIALGIGVLCGRFNIPLPAPITITGVGLILTIWIGYKLAGGV